MAEGVFEKNEAPETPEGPLCVDEVLEKCKAYRQEDDRVQIREYDDLLQGDVTVHAFYVKFLLPIFFDVQCIDWKEGSAPGRHWHYG
jgi:hypothetical protein